MRAPDATWNGLAVFRCKYCSRFERVGERVAADLVTKHELTAHRDLVFRDLMAATAPTNTEEETTAEESATGDPASEESAVTTDAPEAVPGPSPLTQE